MCENPSEITELQVIQYGGKLNARENGWEINLNWEK